MAWDWKSMKIAAGQGSKTQLALGNVVNEEPGVYIAGVGWYSDRR